MGKYGEIIEDFYSERSRILNALQDGEYKSVIMRLIGSLAFRTHCQEFGYIQDKLGRKFTDFDFVSYPKYFRLIVKVLTELGYEEDKQVTQLFGDQRLIFHDPAFGRHIDVFFNTLSFCHEINLVGRLEKEEITIPLAELLLEKMQIVQINEKDVIDTIMLLREHPIGNSDKETINTKIITDIVCNDWGWWRTMTMNLNVVDERIQTFPDLNYYDGSIAHGRIVELLELINSTPKSLKWKSRAMIGDKMKWYKDVEELSR